jgi:hypothetical protein
MKMRAPSIPLITVDPYFSVWSHDNINDQVPYHWTGSPNTMLGTVSIDGSVYRFLGQSEDPVLPQTNIEITALSTVVTYANDNICLTATFTSPMLVTDLYYASRPVAYLKLSWESMDGKGHDVRAKISCTEELVLNKKGEGRAWSENAAINGGTAIRMGNGKQNVLWRSGDDVRIDWGYFYLAVRGSAAIGNEAVNDMYAIWAEAELASDALFAFAYDDIRSLIYFGKPLSAYWNKDGKTITEAISEALAEYEPLMDKCDAFCADLQKAAAEAGSEQYAELLALAYRQVMAAHKLAVDENGANLFVSKECFSNGCAATVDVTYPSAPMFLYYNPELLKGMLRPVFRYARTEAWKFDFAPHDVGQYPLVNGQVYGNNELKYQMPVEECGNMIILTAAICKKEKDPAFAYANLDLISLWSEYLVQYGADPGNQLCTDDFAGHLAHNCNLAIKAIMGIAGYSSILSMLGRDEEAARYMSIAKEYAATVCARAKNPDGSYRLAFDQEGTFSLKYNAVWDKLWGTELFPAEFYRGEINRYRQEALPYGVPLDSREKYTKSDWLLWAACLTDNREDFNFFVSLLWKAYHTMRTRVPMTDWYFVDTSEMCGFQHRTVQGGLFLKLLFD